MRICRPITHPYDRLLCHHVTDPACISLRREADKTIAVAIYQSIFCPSEFTSDLDEKGLITYMGSLDRLDHGCSRSAFSTIMRADGKALHWWVQVSYSAKSALFAFGARHCGMRDAEIPVGSTPAYVQLKQAKPQSLDSQKAEFPWQVPERPDLVPPRPLCLCCISIRKRKQLNAPPVHPSVDMKLPLWLSIVVKHNMFIGYTVFLLYGSMLLCLETQKYILFVRVKGSVYSRTTSWITFITGSFWNVTLAINEGLLYNQ